MSSPFSQAAVSLSRLPPSLAARGLQLSADGQLYLECKECESISRVPIISVSESDAEFAKQSCKRCSQRKGWKAVAFRTVVSLVCHDCRRKNTVSLSIDQEPRCASCDSINIEITGSEIRPPFPNTFFELDSPLTGLMQMGRRNQGPYEWGVSAGPDASRIKAETKSLEMLPDAHRYLFAMLCFGTRLHESHSDQDLHGRYVLANVIGEMAKNYLRQTGAIGAGLYALGCFAQMVEMAPNPLNKAVAKHSFAMGAYSLLSQASEELLSEVSGHPDIRGLALGEALDAEAVIEEQCKAAPDERLTSQLGRVRYVIGDLMRVGKTDDEQRRKAIEYFRTVYSDPVASQGIQVGVGQSWGHTVFALTNPSEEEIKEATNILSESLAQAGSDLEFSNLWRDHYLLSQLQVKLQDWRAALDSARKAAAAALQQFNALSDESQLLRQAETFVPVFEHLAFLLAAMGAKDDALNAVELSRAASLRLYTMGTEDRQRHVAELKKKQIEDLLPPVLKQQGFYFTPPVSQRDILDFFSDNPIDPAVGAVLNAWPGESVAFVSLFLSDGFVSGIVYARDAKGRVTLDAYQWETATNELDWLRAQKYVAPGPFRERLIEKSCLYCARAFLSPLAAVFEAVRPNHIMISAPGIFSRLPFEVALRKAVPGLKDWDFAVSCLPSLRVGADILQKCQAHAAEKIERVLLIGYDGNDMPHVADEARQIGEIWGKRLTVLQGSDCTKRRVLEELAKPYDLIHFLCHGTYNEASPLASALHFIPDAENDARRVTAYDLLRIGSFSKAPVIVLAACSSGLTADARSNSFHGLPGSFFRMGARAIIGSRWPVHDDSASATMVDLHHALVKAGGSIDATLAKVLRKFPGSAALEDTAAFTVFGIG